MAPIDTSVVAAVRLMCGAALLQHLWFLILVHSNHLDYMEGDVGILFRTVSSFTGTSLRFCQNLYG